MNLRTRVLSGLFWVGGTRLLGQAFTWVITIFVIRLLTPSDYGLLAMATVFMSLLTIVAEAGLGSALIQAPELDDLKLRRIFGTVILFDLALFALQFSAAPLIARLFEEERLVAIIRALALQFLLMMFTVIPASLLSRKLDFKRQSMIGLASSMLSSLCSLVLAYSGYGVWALVISSLLASFVNAIAINVVAPFLRRPEFSFTGMRGLLVFGGQVTAARALWALYSQADVFIAGKVLGKELLGFYSISMHLASLPVQKVSAIINYIAFPAFSEAQREPEAIPFYLIKGIRILSFVSFPVLWGISSIAPEIVVVLLGPRWEPSIVPLQFLPLVMPLTILGPFLNTAFQGIGRPRVVFMNTLTAALILPAAIWIGTNWELVGMSVAWVIGYPLVFLINLSRMLPIVGLRMVEVGKAAMWPAVAGSGMYASVAIVRWLLLDSLPTALIMAILIIVGIASYTLVTVASNRSGVREVLALFRYRREGGTPG